MVFTILAAIASSSDRSSGTASASELSMQGDMGKILGRPPIKKLNEARDPTRYEPSERKGVTLRALAKRHRGFALVHLSGRQSREKSVFEIYRFQTVGPVGEKRQCFIGFLGGVFDEVF